MAFGGKRDRAPRVRAAVLRHGRRALLTGGFLLAAWAAGTATAGAEEAETRGALVESVPMVDSSEVAAQTEDSLQGATETPLEDAADDAGGLVEDAVAPAADAAPPANGVLDPVVAEVETAGEAPWELTESAADPVSGSLDAARSAADDPRDRDASPQSVPAPDAPPEHDSAASPSAQDRAHAPEPPALLDAADDTASSPADSEPASDPATDGGSAAPSGPAGAAVTTGSGSVPGPAFADQARAPGLPADTAGSVVRTASDVAAVRAEAEEPTVSPD